MPLRKLVLGLCSLAILLGGAGCGHRNPRVLRLALPAGPAAYWRATGNLWAKLAAYRLSGRVVIKVLPGAADARAQLKAVRAGQGADCAFIPAPVLAEQDRAFHVFALAWLFPDADTAARVCEGPMGEAMLKRLDRLGLVGLAYGSSGFWQLATRSTPVRKPSDLRGLTIALPAGTGYAPLADTLLALGARPAPDARKADGWEWSIGDRQAPRALTLWNAAYEPFAVVINKRAWDSLTESEQGMLQVTAGDAVFYPADIVEHQLLNTGTEKMIVSMCGSPPLKLKLTK
jgi:TRAP-type C4-dicarboxylate transport system substrate-binding protein